MASQGLLLGICVVLVSVHGSYGTCGKIDIVFALDASGSVGPTNWQVTLNFSKAIVSQLEVGPNAVQIGINSYDTTATVAFNLNAYTTTSGVLAAIDTIPYSAGGTAISSSINLMHTSMFTTGNGARVAVPRMGIVLTDGVSTNGSSRMEADLARKKGILLFAVGVGSGTNRSELTDIANDPTDDYLFQVADYNVLDSLIDQLKAAACNASEAKVIVEVGDICSIETSCYPNAECTYDGGNAEITRCLCKYGYVDAYHNGQTTCAEIITRQQDSACEACIENSGVCYDVDDNSMRDGCMCQSFTSGTDCEISHVNLTCNVTTFTMALCYNEPVVSSNEEVMFVDGKGLSEACRAVKAQAGDPHCSAGEQKLILPLEDSERKTCGTKKMLADITISKYQNTILVQRSLENFQLGDISFVASCLFDRQADLSFVPIGQAIATSHEKGDYQKARLTLVLENHFGNPIPEGVALRLGDKIRFKIVLTVDGTYTAIRILRCIASSSPTVPDPRAVVVPLILSSCPHPQQTHFTEANNWQQVSGKASELRTGLVRMFKLSQGRAVHLHCSVKLCLKGTETDCGPVTCSYPVSHTAYGRKKRATDSFSSLVVSRKLEWYQPSNAKRAEKATDEKEATFSPVTFAIVVSLLGLAVVGFVVLTMCLVFRIRQTVYRTHKLYM